MTDVPDPQATRQREAPASTGDARASSSLPPTASPPERERLTGGYSASVPQAPGVDLPERLGIHADLLADGGRTLTPVLMVDLRAAAAYIRKAEGELEAANARNLATASEYAKHLVTCHEGVLDADVEAMAAELFIFSQGWSEWPTHAEIAKDVRIAMVRVFSNIARQAEGERARTEALIEAARRAIAIADRRLHTNQWETAVYEWREALAAHRQGVGE